MRKGRNIYKRKDGRWEARYPKGTSNSGKQIYGSCYGKTYSEALRKQKQKMLENQNVLYKTKYREKEFSIWCDHWLEQKKISLKESSYDKYVFSIEKHIKPYFRTYSVHLINEMTIAQFTDHLLEEQNLSSGSVRGILQLVRSILEFAQRQLGIVSPVRFVFPKENKTVVHGLSTVEYQRIVAYLLKHLDCCNMGILLSLQTGLRIGELCALRWSDIDLERSLIHVNFTLVRLQDKDPLQIRKTKMVLQSPKSKMARRAIPISTKLQQMLQTFSQDQLDTFLLTGTKSYMNPRTLQMRLKKIGMYCEIDRLHFHRLRHTFASRCIEHGFDLKAVSELLGHTSIKITMDIYVHSSLSVKRSYIEKLPLI